MADIRCPNCGENNPDFLDLCQFCQTPLKPESMVHIGESPTKKDTGELEPILPEWLKDLRQQAKESAEENAAEEAAQSHKDEAPDLLAGLASQANVQEDEIPDWLANLNPVDKAKPPEISSTQAGTDFFEQFEQGHSEPGMAQEDASSTETEAQSEAQEEQDKLSEWFSRAASQPSEPFTVEPDMLQDTSEWVSQGHSPAAPSGESSPQEKEDLSWLHDLEASAKHESPTPLQDSNQIADDASIGSSSQEDLSWLDNLGGVPEPSQPEGSSTPQEDLSWLENLGGVGPSQVADQFSASPDDLNWLDNLGSGAEAPPQEEAKPSPQEDLSWLNDLDESATSPEPAQPPAVQEDLNWLNTLEGTSEPSQLEPAEASTQEDSSGPQDEPEISEAVDASAPEFSPRHTAPLSEEAESESMPDWLKSATEEPSMPPLGAEGLDWLTSQDLEKDQLLTTEEEPGGEFPGSVEEAVSRSFDQPQDVAATAAGDLSPDTSKEADSLFSIDMPDWLSQPAADTEGATSQQTDLPFTEDSESLAPVELPSWVQAMRPVEAVISETTSGSEDQPLEQEGPLAGLRGVIPAAPIGSSRRPKAISLKLQATNEQQASAALLEQMLAAETAPRPLDSSAYDMPQRVLRWIIAGLVVIVLGAMIGLRSQSMPVSSAIPVEVSSVSNAILDIPENAPVLVAVDYKPSLAGEMEAISGPLLNQIVISRHPTFSFLSMTPNGSALVERLMSNTRINKPAPEGLGYQSAEQYINLGYLPGGSAGVLAFVQSPQTTLPVAEVENFSDYAAVLVLTDQADSGRVWVEQLEARRQNDPTLASQPLLVVASAQAGPLLRPYMSSRQITGMISGLSDAARYEFVNNVPPGTARTYWDTFGIGLLLAIMLITFGSLWSLFTRLRPRRVSTEQG